MHNSTWSISSGLCRLCVALDFESVYYRKRCTKWLGTNVARALSSEFIVQSHIIRHIVHPGANLKVCAGCSLLDDVPNLARTTQNAQKSRREGGISEMV